MPETWDLNGVFTKLTDIYPSFSLILGKKRVILVHVNRKFMFSVEQGRSYVDRAQTDLRAQQFMHRTDRIASAAFLKG